jgi:hypothetical protein
MTVSIEHSLKFVTEFDETNPVAQRLLELPKKHQVEMLESMLANLLAPMIQPAIDELNEGNTYALLKVVDNNG